LVELKPTARHKGALAVIQSLVSLHQQQLKQRANSEYGFETGLRAVARLCPKGSEIIVLSDFSRFTPELEPQLSRLNQHNRVRLVQIVDPLERGETKFRGSEQVSDQTKTLWLDFSSTKTRQGIGQAFEQQQHYLQQLTQKMGISFSTLSSDAALTQQIHGF
jgi:hypothetical protein